MESSKRTNRLLAYICVPVIFGLLGYFTLWIALRPVWDMVHAAAGLLIAEDAPNFNPELTSIFVPGKAEEDPVPVYETTETDEETGETVADSYIKITDIDYPDVGTQYGQLQCERIGLDCPAYWGDTDEILEYGAGQYLGSFLPGFGRVIVLAGHNLTWFASFQFIEAGDVIKFSTNYCNYEYTVTKVEVLNENVLEDVIVNRMPLEQEELIMYTCHPFYAITGRKTDRLTVFAERTQGYDVKWRGIDE